MAPRIIPTKIHGIVDYATGAMLLAASAGLEGTPALAARVAGGGAIAQSLLTDYELGVVRLVPMPVHLAMDAAMGATLAASALAPAGDGARGLAGRLVPVLAGLGEIAAAAMTRTEPPRRWRRRRSRLALAS